VRIGAFLLAALLAAAATPAIARSHSLQLEQLDGARH
jgi:hypothetical protein